jgi:carbohydrate-binding DOMON domain-containing protein
VNWTTIISAVKKFIEDNIPAIAIAFWNYEEGKITAAKNETDKVKTELQMEKNHEAVDQKYAGKSDTDILNDAIASEGVGGQLKTDNEDDGDPKG